MKRFLYLPLSLFSVCALPACDREQQVGGEGANASLFNQLFAQSEEERPQKVINMRDADLDRELEVARRQLQRSPSGRTRSRRWIR